VAPDGYGRTIYLRLPDGRTAVYGHLSRLAPKLESILRQKELEAGIYRVDFPLDSQAVIFQRGETIAWTGSSGIGAPHLHFEVRRGAVQLDPLPDFTEKDIRRPVISGLRIVDAVDEHEARYSKGRVIQLQKGTGKNLSGRATLREGAPFVLLLKARDPLPYKQHRPWTRCVLWQEQTGDTLADIVRDGIDLLAPRTLWASVDHSGWRYGREEWWRLHAGREDNLVPFRALRDRTERFLLDVYDAAGNRARVELRLTMEKEATAKNVNPPSDAIEVGGQGLRGFEFDPNPQEKATHLELLVGESSNEVDLAPEIGLYHKATLSWKSSSGDIEKGAYLYWRTGTSKRFISSSKDADGKHLMANISFTGTFGVSSDTTPPILTLRVQNGEIVFKATDAVTGIEDRSVRCTVDGRTAIAQYEPEEKGGAIWTPFELDDGKHEVVLQAADKVGNLAKLTERVTLRRGSK
jgi:hypothetical protein